jgi:hypothetical protein
MLDFAERKEKRSVWHQKQTHTLIPPASWLKSACHYAFTAGIIIKIAFTSKKSKVAIIILQIWVFEK